MFAGAEVAEEVMRLLVGDVRDEDGLDVGDIDELELLLKPVIELELVLLALLEASLLEDSVGFGTVTVPSVVGAVRLSALSVKLKVKLGRVGVSVIPVADANTLVARSLAVPHPNWKNPPSKTFL